jgi:tricorn protease-like protein
MYHFDPDNQSITKLPINFREKMPNYVDVVEFLILKIVARENIDNDYRQN